MRAPAPTGSVLLLGTLLVVSTFNYTDRILLAVFAEPLKRELLLSDAQLGLLGGLGFALVYTLFGLVIGRLADRKNRIAIIAIGTIVWSAATVACGFATGFLMLLIARAGVGLGEACFLPPAASLLADRFAPEKRGGAMAVVQLGSPIALLLTAFATFWIGPIWGWRAAFWLIGGAGILAGAAVLLLKDERRPGAQAAAAASPGFWRDAALILREPGMGHIVMGGTLALFAMGSIGQFLPPFFVRVHQMEFGPAGLLFGSIQFVAAMTGLLIGGYGSDRLARRDPRWRVWLPGCGVALAAVAYATGFWVPGLVGAALGIALGGVGLLSYLAPTLTLVQSLVPPERRGMAIAIYTLVSSIVGAGLGPWLVGRLSDLFAANAFAGGGYEGLCPGGRSTLGAALDAQCRAAAASGLNLALLCCTLILAWSAAHYFLAARHLKARDGR